MGVRRPDFFSTFALIRDAAPTAVEESLPTAVGAKTVAGPTHIRTYG